MAVFGLPGPAISRSAIVHDPFDKEAFAEILPKATGLRLLLNESDLPMANDLAFDLFCSLYKYFVKLRSPQKSRRRRKEIGTSWAVPSTCASTRNSAASQS